MELGTATDQDVATWIATGTPPIYFGFGSTPIESPVKLLAMIEDVCKELGERALVSAAGWDSDPGSDGSILKIVNGVNYPTVFPKCRAVVHHGGAGTLAAGIRAGVPTVALWSVADQPLWASRTELLHVGKSRKFSRTTRHSLLADLRTVLNPEYASRTRELATQMMRPSEGVSLAADLIEKAARSGITNPRAEA
jgi:UDP:flavonoid glycosyltransferase YjiC (YdhE family)